jgi:hypothetical protein
MIECKERQQSTLGFVQVLNLIEATHWSMTHFLSTVMIMILHFNRYWRHISNFMESNWLDVYDLDRYSLMIIVLKKEMKSMFVYSYIAFFYTWLQLVNSTYTVTYLNLIRSLIEASILPAVLIVGFDDLPCIAEVSRLYRLFYVPTMIIKVPLFILMRYAESESNFFLNEFQTALFKLFCHLSSKLNIY